MRARHETLVAPQGVDTISVQFMIRHHVKGNGMVLEPSRQVGIGGKMTQPRTGACPKGGISRSKIKQGSFVRGMTYPGCPIGMIIVGGPAIGRIDCWIVRIGLPVGNASQPRGMEIGPGMIAVDNVGKGGNQETHLVSALDLLFGGRGEGWSRYKNGHGVEIKLLLLVVVILAFLVFSVHLLWWWWFGYLNAHEINSRRTSGRNGPGKVNVPVKIVDIGRMKINGTIVYRILLPIHHLAIPQPTRHCPGWSIVQNQGGRRRRKLVPVVVSSSQ